MSFALGNLDGGEYNKSTMNEYILLFILVALILGYVSVLIFINLTSQGVADRRVYRLLIELWTTFALIIAILAFITQSLGAEPTSSLAAELAARLAHWSRLTVGQQAFIIIGLLLAVLLFAHFVWSLGSVRKWAMRRNIAPADGGHTE